MTDELTERFCAASRAAACEVHEVADVAGAAALVASRAAAAPVAVAPSLAGDPLLDALGDAGVEVLMPDDAGDPVAAVADAPLGVVRGIAGVAETGSVLVSERALADRVVSMLCRRLVQVVDAEAVVGRLEDAAEWLAALGGQAGFASLMTGPSRTADIERSLTIGVQGPDAVDVVVVG